MEQITKIETVRTAIECSLPKGGLCLYLSHPLTTGAETVRNNIDSAARIAETLRARYSRPVVNPTAISNISGWDQDMWMRLWLPFISERIGTVVMAPLWESSRGCTMEQEHAIANGVPVIYF